MPRTIPLTPPHGHCAACFTAKYPVPFDEGTEKYSLEMNKC